MLFLWLRRLAATGAAALGICAVTAAHAAPDLPPFVSDDAGAFAEQLALHGDPAGLPFAIVDKQAATLQIYAADGALLGVSPVLLGSARGDRSLPGVGQRTQLARLAADDRTTPAGRFASQPGHNLGGEDIVWVDYQAAFAIHRLRAGPSNERRADRLASATPFDNRVSAGCVVVPVAFYEDVVRPTLGHGRGVVYVLPEGGRGAWEAPEPGLMALAR